ncbi:MAG: hypothetical protein K2N35_13835 [Muribaculaceae bacterium]|nr:hypothetical protein [Muribaculaceae bacterium]
MNSVWIKSLKESGEHSYHRRAINHDYYAPFIYHIILKKSKDCESFGSVVGDARIAPGLPGSADIDESRLGKIIAKEIIHLPYEYPIIMLHQFKVMPDHVHILLQVLFRSDKHLDFYIATLRKRIAVKYTKIYGSIKTDEDIFEYGYCDKPLYDNRSLDALYEYIRQNPHRLAMRQQFPQFFQHIRSLKIGEEQFEAYGNLFLFRNPDKEAVKISRKFTQAEKEEKSKGWITSASRGTILVSPFISADEKGIRSEAEAIDAKIILIVHEAFPDRYKPAAHDFALCAEGRLLIISLGLPIGTNITYPICSRMNDLAKAISEM